jgi:hypothetical protein
MSDEAPVSLSYDEIGLLLHWMYRAGASGLAASQIITKLQNTRKLLLDSDSQKQEDV